MQVSHISVRVATSYKGRVLDQPVWKGRYIIRAADGTIAKNTEKTIGPAHTKRSRPPEGFFTEQEALAVTEARARAEGALIESAQGITFGDAAADYMASLKLKVRAGTFKASTLRSYHNALTNWFLPRLRDQHLRAITADDVGAAFRQKVAQGVKASTLNQHRTILRGIFRLALKDMSAANAWEWVQPPRHNRSGSLQFYTPAEVLRLVEHATSLQDAAIFMTSAFTGLRSGESLSVRWRQVNPADSLIHVEKAYTDLFLIDEEEFGGEDLPKSYKVRSMPMMPQVAEILSRLRQREFFTGDDDLVFCNDTGGHIDRSALYRRFKKAQTEAGLHRIRLHDLRHSFGTMAVRAPGVTIVDVQTWMGHADVVTTRGYTHYAPQPDAAKALGSLITTTPTTIAPVIPIRQEVA